MPGSTGPSPPRGDGALAVLALPATVMLSHPSAQCGRGRWTPRPPMQTGLCSVSPVPTVSASQTPRSASPGRVQHHTCFGSWLLLPARKCCWIRLPASALPPKWHRQSCRVGTSGAVNGRAGGESQTNRVSGVKKRCVNQGLCSSWWCGIGDASPRSACTEGQGQSDPPHTLHWLQSLLALVRFHHTINARPPELEEESAEF